jgi:hypothetical protein
MQGHFLLIGSLYLKVVDESGQLKQSVLFGPEHV